MIRTSSPSVEESCLFDNKLLSTCLRPTYRPNGRLALSLVNPNKGPELCSECHLNPLEKVLWLNLIHVNDFNRVKEFKVAIKSCVR